VVLTRHWSAADIGMCADSTSTQARTQSIQIRRMTLHLGMSAPTDRTEQTGCAHGLPLAVMHEPGVMYVIDEERIKSYEAWRIAKVCDPWREGHEFRFNLYNWSLVQERAYRPSTCIRLATDRHGRARACVNLRGGACSRHQLSLWTSIDTATRRHLPASLIPTCWLCNFLHDGCEGAC
jgi:hypothetical protein